LLVWAGAVSAPRAQFQKVFAPLFSKSGRFLSSHIPNISRTAAASGAASAAAAMAVHSVK
jgi:hypothetical protein